MALNEIRFGHIGEEFGRNRIHGVHCPDIKSSRRCCTQPSVVSVDPVSRIPV